MRNEIRFSSNFNNKLAADYFPTIRLKSDKYRIGETYAIFLHDKLLFYADIVEIKDFYLHNLSVAMATLDIGYMPVQARQMIMKMFQKQKIDWQTRQLSFIVLHRLRNAANLSNRKETALA